MDDGGGCSVMVGKRPKCSVSTGVFEGPGGEGSSSVCEKRSQSFLRPDVLCDIVVLREQVAGNLLPPWTRKEAVICH